MLLSLCTLSAGLVAVGPAMRAEAGTNVSPGPGQSGRVDTRGGGPCAVMHPDGAIDAPYVLTAVQAATRGGSGGCLDGSHLHDAPAPTAASASGGNWTLMPRVPRAAASPGYRDSAGYAYDPVHHDVVFFGGRYFDENFNGYQMDDTWTWNGTTWQQRDPATSPPARIFAFMSWDSAIQRVVLFGGETCTPSSCSYLNDTWIWDGTTWTQVDTANSPSARVTEGISDDPVQQDLVLFGGVVASGSTYTFLSDTWTFDGSTWSEEAASGPSPRDTPMAYSPADNGVILEGGADTSGTLADTWLWNGTSWAQLLPATQPPAALDRTLAYDATDNNDVLMLPSSTQGVAATTWTWDGSTWMMSTAASPLSRFGEVFAYDADVGGILMYGGEDCLPQFEDEWIWKDGAWQQVDMGERFPPQTSYLGQQAVLDTTLDRQILYGGFSEACGPFGGTWIQQGGAWTPVQTAQSPPGVFFASMAYDPVHHDTVLFGGETGIFAPPTNETWIFNGSQWTQVFPANSPSARMSAVMAFDSVSQKIVLFGGTNSFPANDVYDDTWTWDGSDWTAQNPTLSPPPLTGAVMARDAQGVPTLFGGETSEVAVNEYYNYVAMNETWQWHGATSDWSLVTPGTSTPSARYWAAMGYDAVSGDDILFGGTNSTTGTVSDLTWAFDGSSWTQLTPATSPSDLVYHTIADGDAANPLLVIGGDFYPTSLDIWMWSDAPASVTPEWPVLPAGVVIAGSALALWRRRRETRPCLAP